MAMIFISLFGLLGWTQESPVPKELVILELYHAGNLRDPFIPLSGSGGNSAWTTASDETAPELTSLALKGIIQGKNDKIALVSDSSTGASFVVNQRGKLVNHKGKEIPGFVGILKGKSLILMTQDKQVRELTLTQEEQP